MDIETVVVGAGVVGLAIARELAMAGHEVLVLEEEHLVGSHTSSRNSEVIHAGIYYEPGSHKARFCVEGKRRLYAYCAERAIPARAIGKLIVATDAEQAGRLDELARRAVVNGVDDLRLLGRDEIAGLEPELDCEAALFSPSSGIVDVHAFMLALQGDAEAGGAQIVLRTRAEAVTPITGGLKVRTSGGEAMTLGCRHLVNAAGLGATRLAQATGGYPPSCIPELRYAKGNYFSVSGRSPFSHLIYPLPVPGGLGIHVTLDLADRIRLGPDLHWVDHIDYKPDESQISAFYRSVSSYWPGILRREIGWSYAGIRPKIGGPGRGSSDFMIHGVRDHGIGGLVSLFGIESPGLTSALAIASYAAELLARS